MKLEKITNDRKARSAAAMTTPAATAHALDLVGERWALLVMRELMFGPKRFSDLRAEPARHQRQRADPAARGTGGRRACRAAQAAAAGRGQGLRAHRMGL